MEDSCRRSKESLRKQEVKGKMDRKKRRKEGGRQRASVKFFFSRLMRECRELPSEIAKNKRNLKNGLQKLLRRENKSRLFIYFQIPTVES